MATLSVGLVLLLGLYFIRRPVMTKEEARESLSAAIALILKDRREDGLRGVPPDAERETVTVR